MVSLSPSSCHGGGRGVDSLRRLFSGSGSAGSLTGSGKVTGWLSEWVSQLAHAAASSTPLGLGGASGSMDTALRPPEGHVSTRYSSIS